MASENQNFTKWEQDKFVLQFVISDAEENFQEQNYGIFWAYATTADDTAIATKKSGSQYGASASDQQSCRWINQNTIQVTMSAADTSGQTYQEYYHELAISGTADDTKTVVATGTFTLKEPLSPLPS
jgi:type 1 fimbria pilin